VESPASIRSGRPDPPATQGQLQALMAVAVGLPHGWCLLLGHVDDARARCGCHRAVPLGLIAPFRTTQHGGVEDRSSIFYELRDTRLAA
jgi:hypothetical protein